jgi:hypothetical protein
MTSLLSSKVHLRDGPAWPDSYKPGDRRHRSHKQRTQGVVVA